eukprot:NODE_5942_length_894_cov_102.832685_g5714_i0.p1 GENE.NODE_5942_length_894_cov_102.832685_g5714_i0~~NODE_5942_length_894_cov_102.832685_g5714_i0.p1  ORF type:complete len:188 (-),score=23.22 NODE_5942_length_894_cov_102.832685_g5714_i0:236-799(-)
MGNTQPAVDSDPDRADLNSLCRQRDAKKQQLQSIQDDLAEVNRNIEVVEKRLCRTWRRTEVISTSESIETSLVLRPDRTYEWISIQRHPIIAAKQPRKPRKHDTATGAPVGRIGCTSTVTHASGKWRSSQGVVTLTGSGVEFIEEEGIVPDSDGHDGIPSPMKHRTEVAVHTLLHEWSPDDDQHPDH